MSASQQVPYINPIHLKNEFAHRFVRALNNLNHPKGSPYDNQVLRRSRCVKVAAYTTMASVVGSRRAWSRAILWKIRNQSRTKGLVRSNHRRRHAKMSIRRNPNSKRGDVYSDQELKLRKLVPGAEIMDSSRLIDETADYIKCLAVHVEVMKTLVDFYTAI